MRRFPFFRLGELALSLSCNRITEYIVNDAPYWGRETWRWGDLSETWGHSDSEGTTGTKVCLQIACYTEAFCVVNLLLVFARAPLPICRHVTMCSCVPNYAGKKQSCADPL